MDSSIRRLTRLLSAEPSERVLAALHVSYLRSAHKNPAPTLSAADLAPGPGGLPAPFHSPPNCTGFGGWWECLVCGQAEDWCDCNINADVRYHSCVGAAGGCETCWMGERADEAGDRDDPLHDSLCRLLACTDAGSYLPPRPWGYSCRAIPQLRRARPMRLACCNTCDERLKVVRCIIKLRRMRRA